MAKCDPKIEVVAGLVTGFCPTPDGKSVDSVFVRTNDHEDKIIKAALLIDCSGPSCAGSKWIGRPRNSTNTASSEVTTSWGPVKRMQYYPAVAYSTAQWKVPDELLNERPPIPGCPNSWDEGGYVYMVHPSPGVDSRATFIFMAEDNTVIFAAPCKGVAPEDLPGSVDEFQAWLESVQKTSNGKQVPPWVYAILDFSRKAQQKYKTDITFHKVSTTVALSLLTLLI
ncbi:hypothetical protein CBS101457_006951 [Exobasidium rhododendri]|nr:hypothetical protein CBS101457_006951 [Exobasidium rhododendri]